MIYQDANISTEGRYILNILFLAPNINIKARTGDAVHIRELAINLAELGNNITLVAGYSPDLPSELKLLLKHPNVNVIFNKNIFKMRFLGLKDISTLWTCLKSAYKNPPDIIYERCFSCKFGTILSKILKKSLIIEVNGLVEEEAELQRMITNYKFTNHFRKRFRRYFFNHTIKIVTVSQGIKEELVKKYHIHPEKIVVIHNGANIDIFKPMNQKKVKHKLGLSNKIKYVCFVGNLASWQGVEYLIQAVPFILNKVCNVLFLIIGDGIMRQEWEQMVKALELSEYFLFIGNVSYEVVPDYINASDVCISIKKPVIPGSPLKVYEYMSCEKPVIATKDSAYGFEILETFNAGILVKHDDRREVADAIIYILNNPDESKKMGIRGRCAVIEKFSWRNTALRVQEVCEIAISK